MQNRERLCLRLPPQINQRLGEVAKAQYISKNTLAIQIFDKWLKEERIKQTKTN